MYAAMFTGLSHISILVALQEWVLMTSPVFTKFWRYFLVSDSVLMLLVIIGLDGVIIGIMMTYFATGEDERVK